VPTSRQPSPARRGPRVGPGEELERRFASGDRLF